MERNTAFNLNKYPNRFWALISIGVALIYFSLSIRFYLERTAFLDIAFQTFLMIQEKTSQIQVNRFGSGLVHLLPLMAIQLKLPLSTVLMLYSVSFPLVFTAFFIGIVKVFKQWDIGILLLLLYTLITLNGFYWATSELQQGLGFFLLILAGLYRYPNLKGPVFWSLLCVGLVTMIFYHPLMILVFAWACIYLFIQGVVNKMRLGLILLVAVLLTALKIWLFPNWYDTMKSAETARHLAEFGFQFWKLPANSIFWNFSWQVLYGFWAIFILVAVHFIYFRKWMLLLLMTMSSIGWIILIHYSDPNFTYPFYQEVSYMPLALFVGLPFVRNVLPHWPVKFRYGVICLILGQRLFAIAAHHAEYSDRLDWVNNQIKATQKSGSSKAWIQASNAPKEIIKMPWATAYESLLLSSLEGPSKAATVTILADTTNKQQALLSDTLLVADFAQYPLSSLDTTYFKLQPGPTLELK